MRHRLLICCLLVGILLIVPAALADFSTPFIEDSKNQVGNVIEGHGFLLAEELDRGTGYLILVTSDTAVHFLIVAEAERGVVRSEVLGRSCVIRAQVLSRPAQPPRSGYALGMRLKILSAVSVAEANAAKAPTTAPTTRP